MVTYKYLDILRCSHRRITWFWQKARLLVLLHWSRGDPRTLWDQRGGVMSSLKQTGRAKERDSQPSEAKRHPQGNTVAERHNQWGRVVERHHLRGRMGAGNDILVRIMGRGWFETRDLACGLQDLLFVLWLGCSWWGYAACLWHGLRWWGSFSSLWCSCKVIVWMLMFPKDW